MKIPGILYDVEETAAFVEAQLRASALTKIVTGLGRTGVVGIIRGRHAGDRVIGLRADMDALPTGKEITGKPTPRNHQARCMPAAMMAIRPCFWEREISGETRKISPVLSRSFSSPPKKVAVMERLPWSKMA